MTPTEAAGWFQVPSDKLLNGLLGRHVAVDHERLDSVLAEIFGCSPSHAIAENGSAILKCRNNTGVAVRLVAMTVFAVTLALGMGRNGDAAGITRTPHL